MAIKEDEKGKYIPCPEKKCLEGKVRPGEWRHLQHPVPEELKPDYDRYKLDANRQEKSKDQDGKDGIVGKVRNAKESFDEASKKQKQP